MGAEKVQAVEATEDPVGSERPGFAVVETESNSERQANALERIADAVESIQRTLYDKS